MYHVKQSHILVLPNVLWFYRILHVNLIMNMLWTDYVHGQNPCGLITGDHVVFLSFLMLLVHFYEYYWYIMYNLSAGYKSCIMDYVFHFVIMGIMDGNERLRYFYEEVVKNTHNSVITDTGMTRP